MTVNFEDNVYEEDEGIIFISDAQSGNYELKVLGIDQGKYEVIVGQISENNDVWESINGEIIQSPASSQTDSYSINYNNQTAVSIFPTPTVTLIPTVTINPSPTLTPSPTTAPQSTTSSSSPSSSSNNEPAQSKVTNPPISQESFPGVLGMSSSKEEKNKQSKKTKLKNPQIFGIIFGHQLFLWY